MALLHDLSGLETAAAVRSGEVSALEVVEHYLARIEALGAGVGAFITLTPELGRAQARATDAAVTHARVDGDRLGVLHGVPVPIKDLNRLAGVRLTLGSATWDELPDADDNVVSRLRSGGTVCTGKTNTPEFGLPCYTENAIAPPARTPWDRSRSAGGSSGGAAAAVAAGLAPVAQGSDGGGSIRIPASVCGLVGLKPSRGRVSSGPITDGVGDLGVNGPLARTVADAAALLDVMSGNFPGDPVVAPALPAGETFLQWAGREPGRLRVGRYCTPVIADAPVAPECLEAYDAASDLLVALGHDVEDIDPPMGPEVAPSFEVVWSVLSMLAPVPERDEARLLPLTRWLRGRGRRMSGYQLAMAVAHMRALTRRVVGATAAYDAVLTPTLAQPPALVGGLRNDADPAADFAAQKAFTPFTAPYNVTGQPAISLPLHRTAGGLPIGVQLVGRPYGEAQLLSLAGQLERARPWAHLRPPGW